MDELRETRMQIIERLGRAAEYKDNETGLHVIRMSHYAQLLALSAGWSEVDAEELLAAAPMHDIGKIGIPDAILLKPDKLDEKEWILMKKHPTLGHELLAKTTFLQPSTDIPYYHHEKWNGQGYPRGLKGDAIPIAARIFAVIDVWDALCHLRVYKAAWPEEKALALLREEAGKHFDPEIVRLFVAHYDEIKAAALNGKAAEPTASKPA
jgi:putative two-component system response regulator